MRTHRSRLALARRSRRRLVALVAFCLLGQTTAVVAADAATTPAAPDQNGHRLTWQATPSPFRLTFLDGGRPLLGQAAGNVAGPGGRMAYTLNDGSTHRLTDLVDAKPAVEGTAYTVATDEPGRTATVTVRHTPRGLRVSWSLRPTAGVTQVYESLAGTDAEHFLGGGASALSVDLRHQVVLDKVLFARDKEFDGCTKSSIASPFFLSSRGYGVFPDTTAIGRLAFPNAVDSPPDCGGSTPPPCPVLTGQPDRTQLCFKTDHLDYEVYAGAPAEVVRDYTAATGRPGLPPPAEFAPMKWRDTVHGTNEVLEDADQFQRLGIPLGTVWIDNPWELENAPPAQVGAGTSCMGTLRFDPGMFPDPRGMIADLRSRGVHLGLWISPYVSLTAAGKPCPPSGFPPGTLIPAPGDPTRMLVDYTNPTARRIWEDKLADVLSLGVDMVKGDRGDGERDIEGSTLAGGPGTLVANTYPVRYEQATQDVLHRLYGDDYTEVFRGGFTGAPAALHGIWQGDQLTTFQALRDVIRRGQTGSLAGHPVWGSDTGGYTPVPDGGAPTSTLFVRWAQLSAVSPAFEVGGGGMNATPWLYDPKTVDRFRDAAVLHQELFPYLYGLARSASADGTPITRPLGFSYPGDPQAWTADQEFLVGPDLLAAPVAADRAQADGDAGRATPVDVYLPAGDWVDLYTGQRVSGGRHVTRMSTLDDFPLYLRAGSAIGFNARTPDVWAQPWGVNDLDRPGRAGWLFTPGPGRTESTSPDGGRLVAERQGNRVTITLAGAPAETQILLPGAGIPRELAIDGRPAGAAVPAATLRGETSGWTVRPGAFGGTVLKLRPVGGHSQVTFTLS
jgi:alpha-D-xyloside xylohydrolase